MSSVLAWLPVTVSAVSRVLGSLSRSTAVGVPTVVFRTASGGGGSLPAAPVVLDETPLPLRAAPCGLPLALSVTETLAPRVPVAAGLKVTLIVQLVFAARLAPQV